MTKTLPCALAALALATVSAAQRDDFGWPTTPAEQGTLPTVYPQIERVVSDDRIVHEDTIGGAEQSLEALAGCAGGYAAVWIDSRNGNRGIYLGLLGPSGARVAEEQPANPPVTTRQFDAALGLAPDLSGGVVWLFSRIGVHGEHVRFFQGARGFSGEPVPIVDRAGGGGGGRGGGRADGGRGGADPRGRDASGERGTLSGSSSGSAMAIAPSGRGLVAWGDGADVVVRVLGGGRNGYTVLANTRVLNEGRAPAQGTPHLVASADDHFACAWSTPDGVDVWIADSRGVGEARAAGPGRVLDVEPDDGGWWLLVEDRGGLFARRLDARGGPAAEDFPISDATLASADLAVWGGGLAVALEERSGEPPGRHFNGPMRVEFFGRDGTSGIREAIEFPGPEGSFASAPRVASMGARADELLLAWTDRRQGHYDVYFQVVPAEGPLGPEERWNTDEASSRQSYCEVDSNGERAVVVWQDHRDPNTSGVFARLIDENGAYASDELQVGTPADRDGAASRVADHPAQRQPVVAMAAGGEFAAVWKEEVQGGWALRAQVYDDDARPVGPPLALDPGQHSDSAFPAGVTALRGGRGFVAVWTREDGGVLAARLDEDGELAQDAVELSDGRGVTCRRPDVAQLGDGRLFVVWDETPERGPVRLRGRFLSSRVEPDGELVSFQRSPWGDGDLDANLAAGPGQGFLMIWTANEAPTRDVAVQGFDRRGRPSTPPAMVSVKKNEQDYADICQLDDGSYLLAWEDDISYRDHIHVRRLDTRSWTMGPRYTLNQRETEYVEARSLGRVAPLGDGFIGIWADLRRSLSQDVFYKVVEADFDE